MKWSLCQPVWLPPCGQFQLSILIKASSLRDSLPGRATLTQTRGSLLCTVALLLWLWLFYPCLFKSACQGYPRSRADGGCWRLSLACHVSCVLAGGMKEALWQRRGSYAFLWRDLIGGTLSGPGCGEDDAERGQCAELSAPRTDREEPGDTHDITWGITPVQSWSLSRVFRANPPTRFPCRLVALLVSFRSERHSAFWLSGRAKTNPCLVRLAEFMEQLIRTFYPR